MYKYFIVKDKKVIKEIVRIKQLTSKERTHILYKMNQKYPEEEISLTKVLMEVYTPLFQIQRGPTN